MTKKEFKHIEMVSGVHYALVELEMECNNLTTGEMLIDCIKHHIDEGDYFLARHLLNYMDGITDYDIVDYDYSMGTMDYPVRVDCYEDVEEYLEDDDE